MKSYDATEFFRLFYNFSRISPEIAVYLIKNEIILRFLKYFTSIDNTNIIEFPKNLKEVQIRNYEELLLGKPNESQKKIMTKLQELKQKKKEKFWLENNNTNRLFMWKTLHELIFYYRINPNCLERNPSQKGTFDCEISVFELGLFLSESMNILNILNDCQYRISVKAGTELYAYLCYENMKYSEIVLKALLKGFKERDVNSFRPYFAMTKKLIRIKDSISEARVKL